MASTDVAARQHQQMWRSLALGALLVLTASALVLVPLATHAEPPLGIDLILALYAAGALFVMRYASAFRSLNGL